VSSKIKTLAAYSNPLDACRHAGRGAAMKEARWQLQRLASIDLDQEPAEYRQLARSWIRTLRQMLEPDPRVQARINRREAS
jgi:hypothetical protein